MNGILIVESRLQMSVYRQGRDPYIGNIPCIRARLAPNRTLIGGESAA